MVVLLRKKVCIVQGSSVLDWFSVGSPDSCRGVGPRAVKPAGDVGRCNMGRIVA